jgi:beta-phosphoglucomutase family hydrolase
MQSDDRGTQQRSPQIDLSAFEAALFDLDGVLTQTAAVHAAAWKRLFDDYLKTRAIREHKPFEPFDIKNDYRRYVDGRLRYDGVKNFLQSRGISLPYGDPQDGPDRETIHGLGNKKDGFFQAHLTEHGVHVYEDAVRFLKTVRAHGLRTAVVSASKHTAVVVQIIGLADCFDARVDGVESARLHLKGKPAPDGFWEAARRLGVDPSRAIVVEDAVAGVEAGRNGGFGLVIGVDRTDQAEELRQHGAMLVTANMDELAA